MNELALGALLCSFFGGAANEEREYFVNQGEQRSIVIDCVTPTHVFEFGRDVASARDSIHQAVYASVLTGKTPFVVVFDQDGQEGRYEQEIKAVTKRIGIGYTRCTTAQVQRWAATEPFRDIGLDKTLDDLPLPAVLNASCDFN